ncbi:MAG: phage tail protein [Ghiorsea sp.]
MIDIQVGHNFDDLGRRLDLLQKGLHDKAMVMALNKTVAKAKTAMRRGVIAEFNVPSSFVGSKLRVFRANKHHLRAVLDPFKAGGGRSLNVIQFLEKKITLAENRRRKKKGTQKQLRFKIKKRGAPTTIKGAFIGNKGRTVFQRTSDARLPIQAVSTVGVPSMFNTKSINQKVRSKIGRDFPIEFDRAAAHVIRRFNRK